ncbi:hypothetical protein SHKM778_38490 [Streptomyces sp. KM77-8]|uniref:Secreted protein n=1 Tax=Streptomyces haneummycinicus TaxID=3074435 RepID=A0AAT9HJB8_9ACTN
MCPAAVLGVVLAGPSVEHGLVIGNHQHGGNLLRMLDGDVVVAGRVAARPGRLGRVDRLASQGHTLVVDGADVHRRTRSPVISVEAEAEVNLVPVGRHLRMGLESPADHLGCDTDEPPRLVLDLHPDIGLPRSAVVSEQTQEVQPDRANPTRPTRTPTPIRGADTQVTSSQGGVDQSTPAPGGHGCVGRD